MGTQAWGPRRNSHSGPGRAWASEWDWNGEGWGQVLAPGEVGSSPAPSLALPTSSISVPFLVTSDPKEEGLEAQISRLAELIGRLENKVRS